MKKILLLLSIISLLFSFNLVAETSVSSAEPMAVVVSGTSEEGLVKYYPNPLRQGETLNIIYDKVSKGSVQVYILDAVGNLVSKDEIMLNVGRQKILLDSEHLNTGIYFLKISSTDATTVRRLIVE